MIKKIFLGLVILAIAGLAALYFFGTSALNKGIKSGVETFGPRITQTSVRLDSVNLSIFSGSGNLKGLSIGNPEGFKSENIFSLGEIDIAVDLGSITSDKIIIKRIHILEPEMSYEKTLSSSNVKALLENIEEFTGPAPEKDATETAKDETGAKKQVVIQSLIIDQGTIYVGMMGVGQTVPLPRIEMNDIGESGNVTLAQALELVLTKVLTNVGPAIADAGKLIQDGGKAALDLSEGSIDKVGEAANDAVNKATDGIKNLFGK